MKKTGGNDPVDFELISTSAEFQLAAFAAALASVAVPIADVPKEATHCELVIHHPAGSANQGCVIWLTQTIGGTGPFESRLQNGYSPRQIARLHRDATAMALQTSGGLNAGIVHMKLLWLRAKGS